MTFQYEALRIPCLVLSYAKSWWMKQNTTDIYMDLRQSLVSCVPNLQIFADSYWVTNVPC